MPEVQRWLATRGARIMLVYGESDPWSAGGFLPEAQRAGALGVLARWAGVQPPGAQASQSLQPAEPEDWSIDRQRRLPL